MRRVLGILHSLGFNPLRFARFLRGMPRFVRDALQYSRRIAPSFPLRVLQLHPVLGEELDQAGETSGHYFWQDLWAAQRVFSRRPSSHVDVGSRLDGFVSHLLVFMPVTVVDIRQLDSNVPGLTFLRDDAARLSQIQTESIESLSCLHAVEHFGLGRYGDPIDPDGFQKALRAFERVLAPGGHLYLSTPVGRQRLQFNAHRIFAPRTIVRGLARLELASFSAVTDDGTYVDHADPEDFTNADYACGLFEFRKPSA